MCDVQGIGEHCAVAFLITGANDTSYNGVYNQTGHFCTGKPVYQQVEGEGSVLYQNTEMKWWITSGYYASGIMAEDECDGTGFVAPLDLSAHLCRASPDGAGCLGKWEETFPNPKIGVFATVPGSGCDSNPSCGHGVCVPQGEHHSCGCDYGYSGETCDHDPCAGDVCGAHRVCTRFGDGLGHSCDCESGWHGENCGVDCTSGNCPAFAVSGTTDPQYSGTYTKTSHVCHGKPVYQKGGGNSSVLYRESNNVDWDISSSDHATSCARDNDIIWVAGHHGCSESPDGGGCAGHWQDQHGDQTNPQLKVAAADGSGCDYDYVNPSCGHGLCVPQGEHHTCGCDYGYSGDTCEHDPCAGDVCGARRICTRDGDGMNHTCPCDPSWYGDDCEKEMATAFTVSGTTDLQFSGTYTKTAYVCYGKPVYQKGGGNGYVLYHFDSYQWAVGPPGQATSCSFGSYIYSNVDCPLELPQGSADCLGRWSDNDGSGIWNTNPNIGVFATVPGSGCDSNPSCGHGVCIPQGEHHSCGCDYGYSGETCDHDPCAGVDCGAHHGNCTRDGDGLGHSCDCESGWHGENCGVDCTSGNCSAFAVSGATDPQYNGTYTKTAHVCNGKPVYQKGGRDGPVLYRESNDRDWDISSSDHATSCARDNDIIWVAGHHGCSESPDGGGCAGHWQDQHGDHTNPQLKVVAV